MQFIGDIYVSDILHRQVLDPAGEEVGRLDDFTVELGELFPRVSGLIVTRDKARYVIPWEKVAIFNKKVVSTSLTVSQVRPAVVGESEMLACKNLLDRQIVDINGAKVVRVNDLKMGEVKGNLCLIAADVGVSGLFRRLGIKKRWDKLARVLGFKQTTTLISWNFLQPLEPKLSKLTLTVTRKNIDDLHPSDIAQILSDVSQKERSALMDTLDVETMAETMHELEPSVQADIIARMDTEHAADILEEMPPDEAADIIGDLSAERAKEILEKMEADEAGDVQELLEHEEDTAGGMMTTEYISFTPEMTVEEALAEYRLAAPDVETVSAYTMYVTDSDERLLGEVHLKDLVLALPKKTLVEIMDKEFKYAAPGEDEREVAEIISKYNLLALPVLSEDDRILGIVTVDDVVDLILPPQSRRRKHRIG
ncbi:MAG: magnesium transporter [Nitrospirae bacterium]|nr:magnesium transporter [Nitrospirota bacterium]